MCHTVRAARASRIFVNVSHHVDPLMNHSKNFIIASHCMNQKKRKEYLMNQNRNSIIDYYMFHQQPNQMKQSNKQTQCTNQCTIPNNNIKIISFHQQQRLLFYLDVLLYVLKYDPA